MALREADMHLRAATQALPIGRYINMHACTVTAQEYSDDGEGETRVSFTREAAKKGGQRQMAHMEPQSMLRHGDYHTMERSRADSKCHRSR